MPVVSCHLHLVVRQFNGCSWDETAVTVSCTAPTVIDKLLALDSSTQDGLHSVFDFTFSDEQFGRVFSQDEARLNGVKRNADGSFTMSDRKLWCRSNASLHIATRTKWKEANNAGLRLEHIMDAIAEAGYKIVASYKTRDINASDSMNFIFEATHPIPL
jgi:hypothetical protein